MNNNVKIKISCRNKKRFIEQLIINKINLYDIKINEKSIEIIVDKKDLKKIDEIKLIHDTDIINYFGVNKILYLIKKYKIYMLFIILGIILNIFLSNIIFNIEVNTPNKKLEKIILKDLKNQGIRKFHLKKTFQKKEQIKKYIMKKEKNKVEWIEIEEKGTKYIIRVEPRKINKENNLCKPRNIIAKKNAIITKIESSSGEIIKKKNDYVEKNEIIISGLIHNKDLIVSKKCAIGKIYGETWYKIKLEIPKNYMEEYIINEYSYGITINYLKNSINLNHKFPQYEKKEYNIVGSKLLPINISFAKYVKKIVKEKKYNINNVNNRALLESEKYLNKKINKSSKILKKKILKKEIKNSKIIIEVFASVEEDITDFQDISELDIEKINEENQKKE